MYVASQKICKQTQTQYDYHTLPLCHKGKNQKLIIHYRQVLKQQYWYTRTHIQTHTSLAVIYAGIVHINITTPIPEKENNTVRMIARARYIYASIF